MRTLAVLDGEPVPRLGVDLQPFLRETGRPDQLLENDDFAFQGTIVLGMGFTLDPDRAAYLIRRDPRNAKILMPYVGGQDLNTHPDSSASRWVINFHDWPLEVAATFPEAMEQVERLVRPERARNKIPERRDIWWRYIYPAATMVRSIAGLSHVLALSWTSSALMPVRIPQKQVFSNSCVVFATEDLGWLAFLSSSVHQAWVIRYASTLETRIRYAPSDVFLTLPRPRMTQALRGLGEALDVERRATMLGRALGLTKLYNQVHNPTIIDPAIIRLRELQEQIDHAVLAAYGWEDLDPQIGHYPTKIGTRWTVSPQARFELLDRLLVENHRRAGVRS